VIDPGGYLIRVLCRSTSRCTAVDRSGLAVTFNPAAPGNPTPADTDNAGNVTGLACATPRQCTVVDTQGNVATFDPSAPASPAPFTLDPGHVLYRGACPGIDQCTFGVSSGRELTFDPRSPAGASPRAIKGANTLFAVACSSATRCVAVDAAGKGFVGRRADHSRPTIEIRSPVRGAHYRRGTTVKADYLCSDPDGASEVASCGGSVPDGRAIDTATIGRHSFTVHASDRSGNSRVRTLHYVVAERHKHKRRHRWIPARAR
jgi:hypothetical protein